MNPEENVVAGVDEIIKQWVERVEKTGELKHIEGFGKPFKFQDGYLETPDDLRMAYKILKDAGYVPAEVEMLNRLAALREDLAATQDVEEQRTLRVKIAEMQQKVSMMLGALRGAR
jgi:hypothetical protein